MQDIKYIDIPSQYKSMLQSIKSPIIQKIYSNFDFLYFDFLYYIKDEKNSNCKLIINFLYDFLKKFKFITYYFDDLSNNKDSLSQNKHDSNEKEIKNTYSDIANVYICVESNFIIIEQISISIFAEIIDKLDEHQISKININFYFNNNIKTINEVHINEEIQKFCSFFSNEITKNYFVEITLPLISCFIIRRHFYPTNYFTNQQFFTFDKATKPKENDNVTKISNYISDKTNGLLLMNWFQNVSEIYGFDEEEKSQNSFHEFKEKDFIILRTLGGNGNATFHLVIHLDSLYIFMMKKLYDKITSKKYKHEFYFCKNYSHRCLTKFYGFMKEDTEITGFIYEYMSNGTLEAFKFNQHDEILKLTIILRIFEGLKYLYSKSLIHRDLKPLNILIDHDYVAYISDFDTIRHPIEGNDETIKNEMTCDIGSVWYISPEQANGEKVSYPTDIYSFGLIIYFLTEGKHMLANLNNQKDKPQSISCSSTNYQYLITNCTKKSQSERPDYSTIEYYLTEEIISFDYFENLLFEDLSQSKIDLISRFIFESYIILHYHNDSRGFFELNLTYFLILLSNKNNFNSLSQIYLHLGDSYYYGNYVRKDYKKAREHYEIAAKDNNPKALFNLGLLYYNGKGVKKDYKKAIEYFELSFKQNYPGALNMLSNIYLNGFGVKQDSVKAIEYLELSAGQDNSNVLFEIGIIFVNGNGVKKNYAKGIEYLERSAEKNNSQAQELLSAIYFGGLEGCTDYVKARKYNEILAKKNNSNALFRLGYLYDEGLGVEQDYKKAKEYYELSATQNNPQALFCLGRLYEYGKGVKQDYLKSKEYYELGATQNDPDSIYLLAELYNNGFGVHQDYSQAKEYYEISSSLNNIESYSSLGFLYFEGNGVERDYVQAKKYFELAAKNGIPICYLILGMIYENGLGVKIDYTKAKEYYEIAMKNHVEESYCFMGNIYRSGLGVPKDYLRAKYYYELGVAEDEVNSINGLGNLYFYGQGVEQSYLKAKEYYEKSAALNNSDGYNNLGFLYENGFGVLKNYNKAKKYYKCAAMKGDVDGLFQLGNLILNGKGMKQDIYEAIEYFELAAKKENFNACFLLGSLYSSGEYIDIDIPKAIQYYSKCIEIYKLDNFNKYNILNSFLGYKFTGNCYRSYNDLGLIYIIHLHDLKKAEVNLKETAFAEYPYGQNNFGLFYQFYLKDIDNAEYMYERSSKHHFALSEYNLGYLYENKGKTKESIEYYKKASKHVDEPLIFRKCECYDKRLEISKKFIICLTNLKLTQYFLNEHNFCESEKYFMKAIKMLDSGNFYQYKYQKEKEENCFSYIKTFILSFPSFNLNNQPNLNLKDMKLITKADKSDEFFVNEPENKEEDKTNHNLSINQSDDSDEKDNNVDTKDNKVKKIFSEMNDNINDIKKWRKIQDKEILESEEDVKDDLEKERKEKNEENEDFLFDIIIKDKDLKESFIKEIDDIINIMQTIIYTPPYSILFGRMNIEKSKSKFKSALKDINELFYEGLAIDEFNPYKTTV